VLDVGSAGMTACLCQGRVPGCAPGGAVTFFRVAERKSPKKGRPRCPRPLRGNLRCSLQAGSAQTRLPAQTARGPDPPEAVLLGTARGEGEPGSPSGHRYARPWPPHRARRRHWGRNATVGSRCSVAKLVLRHQSRNGGRSAGSLPFMLAIVRCRRDDERLLQADLGHSTPRFQGFLCLLCEAVML